LIKNNVECRPLISGSLAMQPFFKEINMESWEINALNEDLKFANIIHKFGMYIPNHPKLTKDEILFISEIVNNEISK
jgi:CDP-6-deoxy-D-xylo-4-hexulose-3-dehydrase